MVTSETEMHSALGIESPCVLIDLLAAALQRAGDPRRPRSTSATQRQWTGAAVLPLDNAAARGHQLAANKSIMTQGDHFCV